MTPAGTKPEGSPRVQPNLVGGGHGGRQWSRSLVRRRKGKFQGRERGEWDAGPAKGEKSWAYRRTEGLGVSEALLYMGPGFLLGLPLCQVRVQGPGSSGLAPGWRGGVVGPGGSGSAAGSMGASDSYTGIITTVMGWG